MSITLQCHRHGAAEIDLTRYIQTVKYVRSRDITTSEGLEVTLKASLLEATYLVRPGNWLVLRDYSGHALTFGYVVDVQAGITRGANNALVTDLIKVSTISWFELITRAHVYAPLGDAQSVGAFLSLSDLYQSVFPVAQAYMIGKIGASLQALIQQLGKIRLPETMGGEYIGDAIPVVYDEATRLAYAPGRVVEEAATTGGPLTAFSLGAMEAGLGEMIQNAYLPDRNLIEMFCSLEPMDGGTPDNTSAGQSQAPGSVTLAGDSRLAKMLGMRPVVIYRTPPWRTRPLWKSVAATRGFRGADDPMLDQMVGMLLAKFGVEPPPASEASPLDESADKMSQQRYNDQANIARHLDFLKAVYKDITWDYARAIPLYPEMVRSFKLHWSDTARVNLTTIAYASDGKTGIEAGDSAGLPIKWDNSVMNYGPRIARPVWPFTLTIAGDVEAKFTQGTPSGDGYSVSIADFLRAQALQLMQFVQNAHLMATGTIRLNYTDATNVELRSHVLDLPAGEIVKLATHDVFDIFYAYVDSVEHNYRSSDTGIDSADTTVTYSRGLFGFEEDLLRNPDVPAPQLENSTTKTRPTRGRTPTRPPPTNINALLIGDVNKSTEFEVRRDLLNTQSPLCPEGLTKMRTGDIHNAILHYTGGRFGATAASWTVEFQKRYTSGIKPYVPHLIIDKDGNVTQILDLRQMAWHASNALANTSSVGIELIVPVKLGEATALAEQQRVLGNTLPWPILSGYVITSTDNRSTIYNDFFGPTPAQLQTLEKVLRALNTHLGVTLRHVTGSTAAKTIRRFSNAEISDQLARGGVWHHTQFYSDHWDALGVDIPSLL